MNKTILNFSGWDKWDARTYLDTYYKDPMADTYETLEFLHRSLVSMPSFKRALEFGAGPTLFGSLGLEPYVEELHSADYLEQNLVEVQKWLNNDKDAFNWDVCSQYLIAFEGGEPTKKNVDLRSESLRRKITKLLRGDIKQKWPLLGHAEKYDLVVSLFCADSITNSKQEWFQYMKNIFNLADSGGVILIAALRNCTYYKVGDRFFPCANINERDIEKVVLDSGLNIKDIRIEVRDVVECEGKGFTSLVFARLLLA